MFFKFILIVQFYLLVYKILSFYNNLSFSSLAHLILIFKSTLGFYIHFSCNQSPYIKIGFFLLFNLHVFNFNFFYCLNVMPKSICNRNNEIGQPFLTSKFYGNYSLVSLLLIFAD